MINGGIISPIDDDKNKFINIKNIEHIEKDELIVRSYNIDIYPTSILGQYRMDIDIEFILIYPKKRIFIRRLSAELYNNDEYICELTSNKEDIELSESKIIDYINLSANINIRIVNDFKKIIKNSKLILVYKINCSYAVRTDINKGKFPLFKWHFCPKNEIYIDKRLTYKNFLVEKISSIFSKSWIKKIETAATISAFAGFITGILTYIIFKEPMYIISLIISVLTFLIVIKLNKPEDLRK